jgi:signal transduction histidine kinase
VTHPNGRICELRAIPLATEHGKSLGVVTIVRDVTDKALMEAERDALIEKLGRSNDELAGFSRTAAHDIKNPLIGVRGLANQAARSVAAGRLEKLPEYLRRIGAATDQVLEFLDGLLWHSRSGAELGTIEAVGLDSLLPEVATLLEVYLADNGVRIEIAENLPAIRGDRLRLRQLFLNLLSNAAKFSSGVQGAIVRIQARKEGPWVECEVRDNGIGFDPAFSNKIFGLFEKLDPGTEGVGLGLATARRIVEAHGGTISATSEGPGKGCTVTFRLPAADSSSLDTHPAKKQGRLPI